MAGGNAYVAYTRRQTWRASTVRPGLEDDPLAGLDPLLPPWLRLVVVDNQGDYVLPGWAACPRV